MVLNSCRTHVPRLQKKSRRRDQQLVVIGSAGSTDGSRIMQRPPRPGDEAFHDTRNSGNERNVEVVHRVHAD